MLQIKKSTFTFIIDNTEITQLFACVEYEVTVLIIVLTWEEY